MAEEFLPNPDESADVPNPPSASSTSSPHREPARLIVAGSRQGVLTVIHTLHTKAFASADSWSELQPEPMTGKWMSVMTKYIWLEE